MSTASNLDPLSSLFLRGIEIIFDNNGANEWSPYGVAAVSCSFFWAIKMTMKKWRNVEWYGFAHSFVTGMGALVVLYLDLFAAEELNGIGEPLAAATCHEPLTSLHKVIPAITMGFAILDILDGLSIGIDFLLHGMATFSVMAFFISHDKPQIVAPFLLMEVSTIFLSFIRMDLPDRWVILVQAIFTSLFFISRIVIMPMVHFRVTRDMFLAPGSDCHPPYMKYGVLLFGLFFDCLNCFWFYKIMGKVRRKFLGKEKLKHGLELESTTRKESKGVVAEAKNGQHQARTASRRKKEH